MINAYIGDICQPDTIESAFNGVNTVFHAAALISIQYPINFDELYETNVKGKCIQYFLENKIKVIK